jgi:hypothetical protein
VIVVEDAYKMDDEFWHLHRHDTLSKDEKTVYFLVDSLQNLPAFQTWVDIVETVVTGYYATNYIEWGPYASFLSFNAIEGARFRMGGKTTARFNERIRLEGHLAYGTQDGKFKYGGGMLFFPVKTRDAPLAEIINMTSNNWETAPMLSEMIFSLPRCSGETLPINSP